MLLLLWEPRDYQNRFWHVKKSAHASFELRRCQERRVMSIFMCFFYGFGLFLGEARRGGGGGGGERLDLTLRSFRNELRVHVPSALAQ